jgi:hypothetical protein
MMEVNNVAAAAAELVAATTSGGQSVNSGQQDQLMQENRLLKAEAFWMNTPLYFMLWILRFRCGDTDDFPNPAKALPAKKEEAWNRMKKFGPRALTQDEYNKLARVNSFPESPIFNGKITDFWSSPARLTYVQWQRSIRDADEEKHQRVFDANGAGRNKMRKTRHGSSAADFERLRGSAPESRYTPSRDEYLRHRIAFPLLRGLSDRLQPGDPLFNLEAQAAARIGKNSPLPGGLLCSNASDLADHGISEYVSNYEVSHQVMELILYHITVTLEEVAGASTQLLFKYVETRSGATPVAKQAKKASCPLDHASAIEALEKLISVQAQLNPDTYSWRKQYLEFLKAQCGRLSETGRWYLDLSIRTYCNARRIPFMPLPPQLWPVMQHVSTYALRLTQPVCPKCLTVGTHSMAGGCPWFSQTPPSEGAKAGQLGPLEKRVKQLEKQVSTLSRRPRQRQQSQSRWKRVCLDYNDPDKECSRERCRFRHVIGCNECQKLDHRHHECPQRDAAE